MEQQVQTNNRSAMITKVYYNSWLAKLILFEGYSTITLGCFIFTKEDYLPDHVLNEEMIHSRQWQDCLAIGILISVILASVLPFSITRMITLLLFPVVFYYILYVMEYIVSFIHHFFSTKDKDVKAANKKAYYASAMEMEAKENRRDLGYLNTRQFCAFLKYYGRL